MRRLDVQNPRAWCGALVVFGLVVGTLIDSVPEAPLAERGGYRVVPADFHVHSFFEDGLVSPIGLVLEARRQGLAALAITNHSGVWAAKLGQWFSRQIGGPIVLVGQEVTASKFHLIAVGIERQLDWRLSASEAIDRVHAQGGVTIAAHPTPEWIGFDGEALAKLDGTELMHPSVYYDRWWDLLDFYQRTMDAGESIAAIGSSDYHGFRPPADCRTYVFVRDVTGDGILEALRSGRTVVFDPDGHAYGDPEMIQALEAEPLSEPVNRGYGASGVLDRAAQLSGWLGLLGWVLLSPRLPRASRPPAARRRES